MCGAEYVAQLAGLEVAESLLGRKALERVMSQARIFVCSDQHFHHANIYSFVDAKGERIRKEFANVQEGDRAMVERWNAVVTPQDHVYTLGDVTMGNNLSLIKELQGHKRLVLGNHDKCDVRQYREAGFQKVYSSRQFDKWCLLTHIPVHPQSLPRGGINIHGHLHRGVVIRRISALPSDDPALIDDNGEIASPDPRYKCVCVEQIEYTPVLLESLRPK